MAAWERHIIGRIILEAEMPVNCLGGPRRVSVKKGSTAVGPHEVSLQATSTS